MATYNLTVHELFARLAQEELQGSANTTSRPKAQSSRTPSRTSSVSSWFSLSEESEVDFTDYNWRAHEAFEKGIEDAKGGKERQ